MVQRLVVVVLMAITQVGKEGVTLDDGGRWKSRAGGWLPVQSGHWL